METPMITFRSSKTTLAMTAVSALLGLSGCSGQAGGAALGQAAEADTGAGTWQETPINYGVNSTVYCVGMSTEASVSIDLTVSTDQTSVMVNSLSLLGTGATTTTATPLVSGQSSSFQAQDSSGDVLDATIAIGSDPSGNLTIAFSGSSIVTPWWSGSLDCAATVLNYVYPTASDVAVTGTVYVGSTLTGSFAYADAENTTEASPSYQWYRVVSGVSTPISGAISSTYAPTGADTNHAVTFCVTPADTARSGVQQCSGEVAVPGVIWYTGSTQTGAASAQTSVDGTCVDMSSIGMDQLANSVRLDGQASGTTTLRMYTGAGCSGAVYTRYAGANTVHDIELSTVGIGSGTRSYKITW
jgi:hypothetical protein